MVKFVARRWLRRFSARYDYDTGYMRTLLDHSLSAFLKYVSVNILASHRRGIPAAPWWAARIRAAIYEDCGPCVQLVCNMAIANGVSPTIITDVVAANMESLDDELVLVLMFTEQVLTRDPEAHTTRERVLQYWGDEGLVSLAATISATRVYPSMKYALGHGHACSRIQVAKQSIPPGNLASATLSCCTVPGVIR